VGSNVPAGDVREGYLVEIPVLSDDEETFKAQLFESTYRDSVVDSQFEWHVKARELAGYVGANSAEVVDRVSAGVNQFDDLVESCFSAVKTFGCDSRVEVAVYEAEEDGLQDRPVVLVEWAIDEHAVVVAGVGDLP